jgi:hypothetical protein
LNIVKTSPIKSYMQLIISFFVSETIYTYDIFYYYRNWFLHSEIIKENKQFLENCFLNADGTEIPSENELNH